MGKIRPNLPASKEPHPLRSGSGRGRLGHGVEVRGAQGSLFSVGGLSHLMLAPKASQESARSLVVIVFVVALLLG